jgi:hypothetical protein
LEYITSIFKVKEQVKQETSRRQKTCFLLSLLFDPEDGGDTSPQNIGFSANYVVLHSQKTVFFTATTTKTSNKT